MPCSPIPFLTHEKKNIFGIFADEQVFTSSMCGTMP